MYKKLITILSAVIILAQSTGAYCLRPALESAQASLRPKAAVVSPQDIIEAFLAALQPGNDAELDRVAKVSGMKPKDFLILLNILVRLEKAIPIWKMTIDEIEAGRTIASEIDGLFIQIEDMCDDFNKQLSFFDRLIPAFQDIAPDTAVKLGNTDIEQLVKLYKESGKTLTVPKRLFMCMLGIVRNVSIDEEYNEGQKVKAEELTILLSRQLIQYSRVGMSFSLARRYWESRIYLTGKKLKLAPVIDEYMVEVQRGVEEFIEVKDFIIGARAILSDISEDMKTGLLELASEETLSELDLMIATCQDLIAPIAKLLEFIEEYIDEAGGFEPGKDKFFLEAKKEEFCQFCNSLSNYLQTVAKITQSVARLYDLYMKTEEDGTYGQMIKEIKAEYQEIATRDFAIGYKLFALHTKWGSIGEAKPSSAGGALEDRPVAEIKDRMHIYTAINCAA